MPAKQLLQDKERRFQLLFEEHPQPMWVIDPAESKILEANSAAALLYGHTRDQFRGMSLDAVLVSEESGPASGSPRRHRTGSGRIIDVEMAQHLIDFGGHPAELAVLMDVTGRRQLEDQLRQAQKMESVGMLAGGVAHDFNNLLTIISGYSQLILNALEPGNPNYYAAEQILKAGERAAALTKQLLAFSRPRLLQSKVLDLNKVVTGLSTMLRRLIGEDVDLQLVLRPDLGMVSADSGQIEQVLMNLVVNARDAMPKGGRLTIETTNVELDESYSGRHLSVKPGQYVQVAVSDNGGGMDEATQARLFEPFFTTKGAGRGTGLGLSTVFGIVKQSGGNLDVYSVPSRGTSVKVYLPRIDQPAAVEAEYSRRHVASGSETVLLVEDDEMVRHLVRETLVRAGYRVMDTSDPSEARRLSGSYRGVIHLLITDVVMPKVSGRELAGELHGQRGGMKVLYMSGYTDTGIVNTGILQKEVAFLQKPFTPAALTAKVREVLESGGRTRRAGE
ncbi:MAG: ATP-binding protein [Candidatus Solibacter sp.]|nr:ATP-binding protein [Candidatus Solibacter sp.]